MKSLRTTTQVTSQEWSFYICMPRQSRFAVCGIAPRTESFCGLVELLLGLQTHASPDVVQFPSVPFSRL
jgi:hypothetical protein